MTERNKIFIINNTGEVMCSRGIYGIHKDSKFSKDHINLVFKKNGLDYKISDDCNCYLLLDILSELRYKIPQTIKNLMGLIEVVRYYKVEPCSFLVESIVENILKDISCHIQSANSELELQSKIEQRFEEFFPTYSLVKKEHTFQNGKLRVDFLAKDRITNRDVLIEVKKPSGGKINKQLLNYGKFFDNPILVAVNSTDDIKLENIIYVDINIL